LDEFTATAVVRRVAAEKRVCLRIRPGAATVLLNDTARLSLWVRQSVQKTVIEGQYGIGGQCTGNAQTITLEIRPYPKPYKTGVASAQVFLDAWCYDDTGMWYCPDTKTQEIRLK
jgi:hypothetical protein